MPGHPLLQLGRQRGLEQTLPYAGAFTPNEAYELLQMIPSALLIDVRTNAERDWIGKVSINNDQHFAVQWSLYPGGIPNANFLSELQAIVSDKDTVILFLCRSGVRSRHAAKLATDNGFTNCYDILQGFEGDKDEQGHRKTVGGWCQQGLPWSGA
ncbi:rhodanese-like domain-containing protein [Undibacterium sp. SXout20W]|uniref:rhodanese-like domain-containing protein n=1 Tax=Undibacterium sp. SXout20W TaxID=3413051 RepID=UPI003BF087FA